MTSAILTVLKKPIPVQAMQYTGDNIAELREWADITWSDEHGTWAVATLEGNARLDVGAYVMCGVRGEFYPCEKEIFESSYDVLDGPTTFGVVG